MRAAALDEDYIATWPMKAWQQWSRLMDTPHGEPCPVTPEWMWPLTADRSIARTAPYASLGMVFSSHDWFKENQRHPDLHLDVDAAPSPPMPGLIELHQAWQQATTSEELDTLATTGFWESNAPTPNATITEWNWDFS